MSCKFSSSATTLSDSDILPPRHGVENCADSIRVLTRHRTYSVPVAVFLGYYQLTPGCWLVHLGRNDELINPDSRNHMGGFVAQAQWLFLYVRTPSLTLVQIRLATDK